MSVDASIRVYFPASAVPAALRALQGMLAPMPGVRRGKTIKIVASVGEKVALPFHEGLGIDARANHRLAEGKALNFETLFDPERGRDEAALFPVSLKLDLGRAFLEVKFGNIATSLAHLFFESSVRARVGELLDEGLGIAAVSEVLGEWAIYGRDEAADEPLEVPEDSARHAAGVDRFAAFLVARLRSGI